MFVLRVFLQCLITLHHKNRLAYRTVFVLFDYGCTIALMEKDKNPMPKFDRLVHFIFDQIPVYDDDINRLDDLLLDEQLQLDFEQQSETGF